MPRSFSMNAFTRLSCGSQSCVPSSEHESCTMCSNSTPCWSATDAMHSLSHLELRKLGVTMENFMGGLLTGARTVGKCWLRRNFHTDVPPRQTFVRNFCAIGIRRPMPNARGETFNPGAACRRLYSLKLILFTT